MPIIKCTCTDCGWVDLEASDITLWACDQVPEASHYRFTCPECFREVRKLADGYVIGLLVSGGVKSRRWRPPAEALEPHTGPAITYDDLLAFHQQMERL